MNIKRKIRGKVVKKWLVSVRIKKIGAGSKDEKS